ncbi:MAG: GNAT family N-acetyltransferase [Bacilli bacterium]
MLKIEKLNKKYINSLLKISTKFTTYYNENNMLNYINNVDNYIYVCKKYDKIVGFIHLLNLTFEYEIINIGVDKNYRNIKIGSKLLEFVEDLAIKNKINNIFLEVNENNYSAIKLYEKFNFKIIQERKKEIL